MKPKYIEHIGIAVNKIEPVKDFLENTFGLKCYAIEVVEEQKVRTAFFRIGEIKLELLEPVSDESPIQKFLTKRGQGIHHIAFAVDDITGSIESLKNKKVRMINDKPVKGAENLDIAFIHPESFFGVLAEICSISKGSGN